VPPEVLEEQLLWNVWNRWEEPTMPSLLVTVFVLVPTLVLWMYGAYAFANRFWAMWIFVLHLQMRISVSAWYVRSTSVVFGFKRRRALRLVCSAATLLEVFLCAVVYPGIGSVLRESFFREPDGTLVEDWREEVRYLHLVVLLGWLVVLLRCCVGLPCVTVRLLKYYVYPDSYREWRPTFWTPYRGGDDDNDHTLSLDDSTRNRLHHGIRGVNLLVLGINLLCVLSAASHFGPWPVYLSLPKDCDDLDETECALPFPSFHHMKADPTTVTGWRVHLRGLPPLRGGIPFHPHFLNELDGFSTSKWTTRDEWTGTVQDAEIRMTE
jgi:hypothetical protein